MFESDIYFILIAQHANIKPDDTVRMSKLIDKLNNPYYGLKSYKWFLFRCHYGYSKGDYEYQHYQLSNECKDKLDYIINESNNDSVVMKIDWM